MIFYHFSFLLVTVRLRFIQFLFVGLLASLSATTGLAQPIITGVTPIANTVIAPRNSTVAVQCSQPLSAGSAAALRVFSNQRGGLRTGSSGSTSVSGNRLTFVPTYDFKPGETVKVSVTTAAQSASGALAVPRMFQFTAAATGGSGIFSGGSTPAGYNPYNVTMADVDNDGDLDIVAPAFGGASVSIRLNNGSGVFGGGSDPSVGSQPRSVTTADIDGDGDLDLLTANYNANSVSIRFNNGSGIFGGGTDLPVGSQPQSITTADIDGDGDLDFLVANGASNSVTVRFNNGNGTFSGGGDVAVGQFPFNVTTGDVDNDGDLDLLTANWGGGNVVSVRLNNGSGQFSGGTNVAVGNRPRWVTLSDLDADGDLDLLSANYGSNDISVRLNNGNGVFGGGADLPAGNNPSSIVAADIDGDGDLDMLVANFYSSNINVRLNNGNGTFGNSVTIPVGTNPNGIATADIDGDGDLDLLSANFSDNTITVLFNQPPPPQVRIVGDSVLCNGGQSILTARGPVPITAYRWSTGATTASITVAQPGNYGVSVTFSGGTISTDQHLVTAITPVVRITGDTVSCAGQPANLLATGPAARSYRWSTGATTAGISVTQPGTYTVTAAFGTGCMATAQVVVRAPTLLITGVAALCSAAGASTTLTATAPRATSIRWSTGATTATQVVTQPGTYSVVATFASGCTLTVAQVVVRPVAVISGDSVACVGRVGQLSAALPGVSGAVYNWSTGATTSTIAITQAGTYSVAIGYGTGCVSVAQQRVRAGVAVPTFSLGADTTLCEGEPLVLRAPASRLGITYRWSDGSVGATLRVAQPGTYTLQLTGECDTRTISRRIDYRPCLTIPNIITANNDGRNDRFQIQGLPNGSWSLEMYDRWGRKVYETTAYRNDWGETAAPGVYYYLLHRSGVAASYKGWLEVMR